MMDCGQVINLVRPKLLDELEDVSSASDVDRLLPFQPFDPSRASLDAGKSIAFRAEKLLKQSAVLASRSDDECCFGHELGARQMISISGNGKIIFPPLARYSFSRRRIPSLKCHGRIRK